VPHHINRLKVHADNHTDQNKCIADFLLQVNLIADVKQRQQYHCQQATVNFRTALYVYRVILCRQQLRNQVNQFKLGSK